MADESRATVLVALSANATLAVAKGIAGVAAGSPALLAEAAHSIADTANEGLLLTSVQRSKKPPDERHPFGYGKERYFWALLAAVGIFVTGSVFSVTEGASRLLKGGGDGGHWLLMYSVLGLAFLLEGVSFSRALWQVRDEARRAGRGVISHVRKSPDPSVKTVFSEDAAALVGVALAFVGIALHQVTGQWFWDPIASICIGVVLAFVAYALGRDNKDLLVGEAVDPELQAAIHDFLESHDGVDRVVKLLTMVLGPQQILVAAMVDLQDNLDSTDVEDLSGRIDRELCRRWPRVRHVFLDATRAPRTSDHEPVASRRPA